MKKITLILIAFCCFAFLNAQTTCNQTFSVTGSDDAPTVLTINNTDVTCNGADPATSLQLTNSAGSLTSTNCSTSTGTSWFEFTLDVVGGTNDGLSVTGCAAELDGTDITGFTSLTITSADTDAFTDTITIEIDVEVTFTVTSAPDCDAVLTETTNVDTTGDISWSPATGAVDNYNVVVGSASGLSDVYSADVGTALTTNIGALSQSTTYYVTITPSNGVGTATGCVEQTFTTFTPPVNDACAGAIAVSNGSSISGNTDFSTDVEALTACSGGGGSATTGCAGGTGTTDFSPGVWFVITTQAGDVVTVTTDNGDTAFDTELQVFEGSCGALVCVGGDDDGGANGFLSTFCWESSATAGFAPVDYFIYLDGHSGDTGDFILDVSVDNVLSTTDVENPVAFSYYPNPVKNTLTLNAQNNIENVRMYNMLGQEVMNVQPQTVDSELDMARLETGTYFVQVTIANVTKTVRVVKQ